jgi:hypothetical protein
VRPDQHVAARWRAFDPPECAPPSPAQPATPEPQGTCHAPATPAQPRRTRQRYFREFSPGDDFYEALIETHRDLSDEQSEALLNARLILLLANHIGDIAVLREALALARRNV